MSECQRCQTSAYWNSPIPGVLAHIEGDEIRGSVERCNRCRVYPDDFSAAAALLHHLGSVQAMKGAAERVDESLEALKFDEGKPELSLLPMYPLTQVAEVLEYGASMYGRHNWRKGMEWSRLLDASLRHIFAFNQGEDNDDETGLSHLAHAICCLMFLLEYTRSHMEQDDRPSNVCQECGTQRPGDDNVLAGKKCLNCTYGFP